MQHVGEWGVAPQNPWTMTLPGGAIGALVSLLASVWLVLGWPSAASFHLLAAAQLLIRLFCALPFFGVFRSDRMSLLFPTFD